MTVSYTEAGKAGPVTCFGNADPSRTATYAAGASQDAQVLAFFVGDPMPAPDPNSLDGLAARMPTPGNGSPPAVVDNNTGSVTTSNIFAPFTHGHPSKARKGRASISTATYSWNYASAFDTGVVPIVNAIAQVTNGTTDLFNVQVVGAPTNTGCLFQINRVSAGLFGLLTGALGINPTPASVTLHMLALEP